MSYVFHRAAVDLFQGLPSDRKKNILQKAVHTKPMHGGHKFFGNIVAVSVALITSDKQLVFQRRSRSVAIDPGLIMCGIGEGMKKTDLENSNMSISAPFYTALRGLDEEFGVRVENPMECLKLTGFCLNRDLFEWYILGTIDLSKGRPAWDAIKIQTNHSASINKDNYEIEQLYFVPYQPEIIFRFLHQHRENMVNYGIAAAICSMVSDWGVQSEQLKNAALEVLKNCHNTSYKKDKMSEKLTDINMKKTDRRTHVRKPIKEKTNITADDGKIFQGETHNVSKGGLGFESNGRFYVKEIVKIEGLDLKKMNPVQHNVMILRKENLAKGYYYGASILDNREHLVSK